MDQSKAPCDWVVLCAANSWDAVKMADRQLAEHLTQHVNVLYVDPPVSPVSRWRGGSPPAPKRGAGMRVVAPHLVRLSPVSYPGPQRPGIAHLTEGVMGRSIRRALSSLRGQVLALIATSPLLDLSSALPGVPLVYWAQDDYVAGATLLGWDRARTARREMEISAKASLLVAANPEVQQTWLRRGLRTLLIPYGCDDVIFAGTDGAVPAREVGLRRPIAGFIGHLGERIDFQILQELASRGRSVLLVGPRHPRFNPAGLGKLLQSPNVQWIDRQPFDRLPSFMRLIDVGLVPYTRSGFNLGSFPLKTLEYLAAGRPVVATDLPATRWLGSRYVSIRTEPADFADAVEALLLDPRPQLAAARRDFAAQHSWRVRAAQWAALFPLPVPEPERILA